MFGRRRRGGDNGDEEQKCGNGALLWNYNRV